MDVREGGGSEEMVVDVRGGSGREETVVDVRRSYAQGHYHFLTATTICSWTLPYPNGNYDGSGFEDMVVGVRIW